MLFQVGLISFVIMVFEFLLSKQLLFLRGMGWFRVVVPLMLVGYSLGSALSKTRPLKGMRASHVPCIIGAVMFLAGALLIKTVSCSRLSAFALSFLILIWPFIFFGVYFGKVFN